MKNAVIFMLGIGLSIIVGIIIGTNKAEEKMVEYDARYEKIEKDVSTFVDVSNPKTIRLYTKELRRVRSDLGNILDKELETIDLKIAKQFDQIENDLRDIRNMLTQIETSKVGQKIFKK